jgi:hypothetical protein
MDADIHCWDGYGYPLFRDGYGYPPLGWIWISSVGMDMDIHNWDGYGYPPLGWIWISSVGMDMDILCFEMDADILCFGMDMDILCFEMDTMDILCFEMDIHCMDIPQLGKGEVVKLEQRGFAAPKE